MAPKKILVNHIEGGVFIKRTELKEFQGKLKKEDVARNKKLQNRISRKWFSAPIYLWADHENYILDGHQRLIALNALALQGEMLKDDMVPVIMIKAKNKNEAKERVLEYNSRYADMDKEEYKLFAVDLDLEDLDLPIDDFDLDDDQDEEYDDDKKGTVKKDYFVQITAYSLQEQEDIMAKIIEQGIAGVKDIKLVTKADDLE